MVANREHLTACTARRGLLLGVLVAVAVVSTSSAMADEDGAVATVNGHPIARDELIDVLLDAHGVEVLQQLIILRVAKQETDRRGFRVTPADVDAEFQASLDRIAADAGLSAEEATETNKRQMLQQVLDERRVSMAEFMIGMERNAHLRKLVEADLRITDETLREEFERRFGARVVVRHIQIAQRDNRGLNQALELLARGSDFADVARQISKNPQTAARGGEMEPFTFDDPDIPAALREGAFSLKEGGVSNPILAGQYFHILKLERRIPADRARFEDERAELGRSIRARAVPQAMATLATRLFKESKVAVLDSTLRPKYQAFLEQAAAGSVQP